MRPFAFNTLEAALLGRAIRWWRAKRVYRIWGGGSVRGAARLAAAGLLTMQEVPPTLNECSYLRHYELVPTARGRRLWRLDVAQPCRRPRGGDTRSKAFQALRAKS